MKSFKMRGIRLHADHSEAQAYMSVHIPAYKNLLIVLGIANTLRFSLDANRNTETGQIGPLFWVVTRNRAAQDSFWRAITVDPYPQITARGL